LARKFGQNLLNIFRIFLVKFYTRKKKKKKHQTFGNGFRRKNDKNLLLLKKQKKIMDPDSVPYTSRS
jgi:hypothetical protein